MKSIYLLLLIFYISTDCLALESKDTFHLSSIRLEVAVDKNGDGVVDFLKIVQLPDQNGATLVKYIQKDKTTRDDPYRFWLNDDREAILIDDAELSFNDSRALKDCRTKGLDFTDDVFSALQTCVMTDSSSQQRPEPYGLPINTRELEDFAPIAIKITPWDKERFKNYQIELQVFDGELSLINGAWEKGIDYLTNTEIAHNQIDEEKVERSFSLALVKQIYIIDHDKFILEPDGSAIARFIFSPVAETFQDKVTTIRVVIRNKTIIDNVATVTKPIISSDIVYSQFYDFQRFYRYFTADEQDLDNGSGLNTPEAEEEFFYPQTVHEKNTNKSKIMFNEDVEQQHKADIILVHGWRMARNERVDFNETFYKRLYWSGFRGKFTAFGWPTGTANLGNGPVREVLLGWKNQHNYDNSEAVARRTGPLLRDFIRNNFSSSQKIVLTAHSMGNVVVSEALRASGGVKLVDTYIAMQAAEVAGAYHAGIKSRNIVNNQDAVSSSPEQSQMNAPMLLPFIFTGCSGDTWLPFEEAWRCVNIDSDAIFDNPFDMPPDRYINPNLNPDSHALIATIQETGSYYKDISSAAPNIVNFHNLGDGALSIWRFNQVTKPDSGIDSAPFFNSEKETWNYDYETLEFNSVDTADDNIVKDEYTFGDTPTVINWCLDGNICEEVDWLNGRKVGNPEILSFITPGRTGPLGQLKAGGVITGNVNLRNDEFGFTTSRPDHSGQFLDDFIRHQCFYWQIITTSSIIEKDLTIKSIKAKCDKET